MIEKWTEKIVRAANYISMTVLFALMFLVTIDVISRYVFNKPIKGGLELNELGLAILVFLGLSYTALLKGHVSVELIVEKMSHKKQAIIEIFNNILGIIVYSLIAWQGLDSAIHANLKGERTDLLRIPLMPLKLFVFIGAALLCIVLITQIFQSAKQVRERS